MYDVEKMLAEGRTIFPVVDHNGQVVGAVGRSQNAQPKYRCVGKGFVGNVLTENKVIVLTEGFIDVLVAQAQKNDNVVGVVGEVTDEAICMFAERKKTVILFFDRDEYGKKQAAKLSERMRNAGIAVYIYETDTTIDMLQYLMQGNSVESVMRIAK